MQTLKTTHYFSTLVLLLFTVTLAYADTFTWIAGSSGSWNDPNNWCLDDEICMLADCTPGCNMDVPGPGDDVIFDDNSTEVCNIPTSIGVGSITIDADYTGTINQGVGVSIVASSISMLGGTWQSGSSPINVIDNFNLNGGIFVSTPDTLTIGGNIDINGGEFVPNGGVVVANAPGGALIKVIGDTLGSFVLAGGDAAIFTLQDSLFLDGQSVLRDGALNTSPLVNLKDLSIESGFDNHPFGHLVLSGDQNGTVTFDKTGGVFGEIVVRKDSAVTVTMDVLSSPLGSSTSFLKIQSGILDFQDSLDAQLIFNQIFIFPDGTLSDAPGGNVKFDGTFFNNGGSYLPNGGTFTFNPQGFYQFVDVGGDNVFDNVIIDVATGISFTLADTLFVSGSLIARNGLMTIAPIVVGGDVTVEPTFDGNLGQSKLIMQPDSLSKLEINKTGTSFPIIIIDGDSASVVEMSVGASSTGTLNEDLFVTNGTLTFPDSSSPQLDFWHIYVQNGGFFKEPRYGNVFCGGTYFNQGGTYVRNEGKFTFNPQSTQFQYANNGDNDFGNLTIECADGVILTAADSIFTRETLHLKNGLVANNTWFAALGDVLVDSTWDQPTSAVFMSLQGSDSTQFFHLKEGFAFSDVDVNKTGSGNVHFSQGTNIVGNASSTLRVNSGACSFGGDTSLLGYAQLRVQGGHLTASPGKMELQGGLVHTSGTIDPNGGCIRFAGSVDRNFLSTPGVTLYDVEIAKTGFANLLLSDTLKAESSISLISGTPLFRPLVTLSSATLAAGWNGIGSQFEMFFRGSADGTFTINTTAVSLIKITVDKAPSSNLDVDFGPGLNAVPTPLLDVKSGQVTVLE